MQKRSIPKEILIFLAGAIGEGAEYWYETNCSLRFALSEGGRRKQKKRGDQFAQIVRMALYRLEQQGCITLRKRGEKLCLTLTQKGRVRVLSSQLRTAPSHEKGTYTIVFFDIPERERRARSLFRRLLKESEFSQWQRSVWVSRRDVRRLLEAFIKTHNIEPWVTVCTTNDLISTGQKKI